MPRKNKKKHQQIDPVFKQVLEDELSRYHPDLQTEVEVSRMPRTIDAFVTVLPPDVLQNIQSQTPFFYFSRCNQIEFKGRNDGLTASEYHMIRGRTHLWLGQEKISPKEMTVTIVSARKPVETMKYAQDLQEPFVPIEAGYYKQTKQPSVYLIIVNELLIIPKNYPLLVFAASEQKFREFLEQMLHHNDAAYWHYAYAVRPKITKEVMTMAGFSSTRSRADIKFIAEDIGRELVQYLPTEDRLAGLSAKERVAGLSAKERLADLSAKERLADLSAKERLADLSAKERLEGINPEEVLKAIGLEKMLSEMSAEGRNLLVEMVAKLQASASPNQKEHSDTNGN